MHKTLNLNVAQQQDISCYNIQNLTHQFVISCHWQRCRAKLSRQFPFGDLQDKVPSYYKIYEDRKGCNRNLHNEVNQSEFRVS